ncbi:MAG TPA: hypothetical protein VEW08_07295, partial [Steroidobacteraceae bacterium]|nr:hypothetical protein [Steroidobacteraceae bacterium]
ISVGRSHDEEPLSLVLPQREVRELAALLGFASARVRSSSPGAGSDAVLALTDALSRVIAKYEAAVREDVLTVRETETQREALAEIARLARELDKY